MLNAAAELPDLTQTTPYFKIANIKCIALLESPLLLGSGIAESDIFQILNAKEYIPNEHDLPKITDVKNAGDDGSYILSKLSDEELIKLLSKDSKKSEIDISNLVRGESITKTNNYGVISEKEKPRTPVFRLENKEIEPYNYNKGADPRYNAVQKINNLLYSRPQQLNSEEDKGKDEMLFDALVAQLKALCCKKIEPRADPINNLKLMLKKVMLNKRTKNQKKQLTQNVDKTKEHIFLIINDEIKNQNDSKDLIVVDPESLSKNSSVLLLGPIATPLSQTQLKLVMTRIANELSKPEYLPLLRKISEGALEDSNIGLMKSLVTGPDSRRYIKPHRCNHQSKLAKIHGGPKWLICTGYLNINTPSLYD